MRIGYPCINLTVGCSAGRTFRLKSYSESRIKQTVKNNLICLQRILKFNVEHDLLFFRITSDIVPFASHPINNFDWQEHFKGDFERIGEFIVRNKMRVSMHPDQFTLINSIREEIFERSEKELKYHTDIFDLMKLDASSKIQIHVGGVYEDKKRSLERFVSRFHDLDSSTQKRLVIENDDKMYSLNDCLNISAQIHIPVLFDAFHHKINNSMQIEEKGLELSEKTWNEKRDGIPMVDYSSQEPGGLPRQHAETIDEEDFRLFLKQTEPFDFDIMLEIKDKEKSAFKALEIASRDPRVRSTHLKVH